MFSGMMRFEWRYHTKRLTFALLLLIVGVMAFVMVQTEYGANPAHVNSPYAVMQSFGLLSLWTLLTQTMLTVHGALRDDEHGMRELILSRPVGRFRYLASRYLGIVLSGMATMVVAAIVMMLAPMVIPIEADRLGAVQPFTYVWALITFILPDVLLVSALLFAVAAFMRNTLSIYVGGIAIFALYTVVAMLTNSPLMAGSAPSTPEALARAAVLDPFGITAFFEQTRYWTTTERNARLVSLTGTYLWNRLLWTGVAAAVLAVTYRFVSMGATVGVKATRKQRARVTRSETSTIATSAPAIAYSPAAPTTANTTAFWGALRSATTLELRQVFNAWIFRALMLLWIAIFGIEVMSELGSGEFGTRLLATTRLVVGRLADPLRLIGTLVLIYFSAEVVWRERQLKFESVVDATPASNGVFFLAKLITLCALPLVMTALGLAAAIVTQVSVQGAPVDWYAYAAQFWFAAYPLVLLAVAALLMHVVTGNRWTGMIGTFLIAVIMLDGSSIGLEHPMWRYAAAPQVAYSDLDGFGPAALSFSAFMAYWTAFAVMLGVIGWAAWRRGYDSGVRARVARLWRVTTMRRSIAVAAGVFAVVAALLFRETNVVHAWETRSAARAWQIEYEKAYRPFAGRPQPSVVAVEIDVNFDPRHRRAVVHGVLALRNNSQRAIDTVLVRVRREDLFAAATIGGDSATVKDERFGMWRFALARPLQPGDTTSMSYSLTLDRGGIRASGFEQDVAANGSYLAIWDAMPAFGYRSGYEIDDPNERRRAGLGATSAGLAPLDSLDAIVRETRRAGNATSWATMHAVVSTTDEQKPLAPGRLVREWKIGDRNFAEYRADSLMPARFAFLSGRYAVKRVRHGTVEVELWYHPGHPQNVDRILDAATRSLDVLGERFGAYSHRTLRMAEVPAGWPFGAFAMSGMLIFTENRGLMSDPRSEDVDLVTRRVAHEVAHQWWGYAVDPPSVVGATTIVESLAKYSEQLVVASLHGARALPAMLTFDHDRYLSGRANDGELEPTLVASRDESYMYYGKGAVAMHALHDALGDSIITGVLREFIAQERGAFGAATATRLHHMLRAAATTDEHRALVDEWFAGRVMYDMRADSAVATRTASGYRLRASFSVRRVTIREGTEDIGSADGVAVDVVVRGAGDSVLYAGKARVAGSTVVLSVEVAGTPVSVEIDPMVHWIDRERSNNRRAVSIR